MISLIKLLKRRQKGVIFAVSISAITIVMDSIGIMVIIPIMANLLTNNVTNNTQSILEQINLGFIGEKFELIGLINPIFLVMIVFAIKFIFLILFGRLIASLKSSIIKEKRNEFLVDVFEDNFKGTERISVGKLTNTLTEQGFRSSLLILYSIQAIAQGLATIIYILLGLLVSWGISLYIALCSILFVLIYLPIYRNIENYSKGFTSNSASFSSRLEEIFNHRNYLFATKRNKSISNDAINIASEIENNDRWLYNNIAISTAFKEPFLIIFLMTVVFIEIQIRGSNSSQVIVSMALIFRGATAGFSTQKFYQKLLENLPALIEFEKLNSINKYNISKINTQKHENETRVNLIKKPDLEVDSGSIKIQGKTIFEDISVSIPFGTSAAIMGPSGAGKSTLLSVISGQRKLDKGSYKVSNIDSHNKTTDKLNFLVGLVPQDPALFKGSIISNLNMQFNKQGISFSEKEKMISVLKDVGLFRELKINNDLHFEIEENGNNLSGGQKQRLHFAREIFMGCEVILLDEPTSALDAESEKMIAKVIEEYKSIKTFICVTHSKEFAKNFDKVITL